MIATLASNQSNSIKLRAISILTKSIFGKEQKIASLLRCIFTAKLIHNLTFRVEHSYFNWTQTPIIADKKEIPAGDLTDGTYSDDRLIEIVDQSMAFMDKDKDGYITYAEYMSVSDSFKSDSHWSFSCKFEYISYHMFQLVAQHLWPEINFVEKQKTQIVHLILHLIHF